MVLTLIAAITKGGTVVGRLIPLAEAGHPALPLASALIPVVAGVITVAAAAGCLLRDGSP